MPNQKEQSDIRYNREFGFWVLLGDHGESFFTQPLLRQAIEMAWSHGCPVPYEVIDSYGKEWAEKHPDATPDEIFEAGVKMTLHRYAECNFMYGYVVEVAKKSNTSLFTQLTQPVMRRSDEPDGKHGVDHVPSSHEAKMSPMSTITGYALPRIILEQMGRGENNSERTQERTLFALEKIDEYVKTSANPTELLLKLAECFVTEGNADPTSMLSHIFTHGILLEENTSSSFEQLFVSLKELAPTLYSHYVRKLSSEQRVEHGIIDLPNEFINEPDFLKHLNELIGAMVEDKNFINRYKIITISGGKTSEKAVSLVKYILNKMGILAVKRMVYAYNDPEKMMAAWERVPVSGIFVINMLPDIEVSNQQTALLIATNWININFPSLSESLMINSVVDIHFVNEAQYEVLLSAYDGDGKKSFKILVDISKQKIIRADQIKN